MMKTDSQQVLAVSQPASYSHLVSLCILMLQPTIYAMIMINVGME